MNHIQALEEIAHQLKELNKTLKEIHAELSDSSVYLSSIDEELKKVSLMKNGSEHGK